MAFIKYTKGRGGRSNGGALLATGISLSITEDKSRGRTVAVRITPAVLKRANMSGGDPVGFLWGVSEDAGKIRIEKSTVDASTNKIGVEWKNKETAEVRCFVLTTSGRLPDWLSKSLQDATPATASFDRTGMTIAVPRKFLSEAA